MDSVWLTSVAFSSVVGRRSILAFGRSDGSLILKSTQDALPRFKIQQPRPIACLSWRPTCMLRPSKNPLNPQVPVETEELAVGDEDSILYYYAVEWPMGWEVSRDTWPGSFTLVAKVSLHNQQICGLAWSPDGKLLASGGNDNLCCLVEVSDIVGFIDREIDEVAGMRGLSLHDRYGDEADCRRKAVRREGIDVPDSTEETSVLHRTTDRSTQNDPQLSSRDIRTLTAGCEKYRWMHGAAVKAIAFCPWREGLLATGGGSNDKCIHFFHTGSGTALATISVAAQVTSLIWSHTKREIAATFGYTQPDHPYRIAVFSWPGCVQVAAIPWEGELRALYAIPYPACIPDANILGKPSWAREGSIIVASSDESIKFHEIWTSCNMKAAPSGTGTLGGSDILESLEGIDKDGDIIR